MSSVFSEYLRILNAESFKKEISQSGNTRVYFTFGKTDSWANDAAPQQGNTSVAAFNEVWKNMIGAKLITGNEIAFVTHRNDWEANTVYPAYDHCTCSLSLYDQNTKFFIVTPEWNVYKCIANNTANAVSVVMPTQTLTDRSVEETDGYVWKYMYTVSDSEKLRFTTESYIPVKTLSVDDGSQQWQVQNNAVSGSIDAIKVANTGSGYSNSSNIVITISGDGTGANAIARINTVSQTVDNVAIVFKGEGYTYAYANITGGGGSGANLRAIISPPGGHGSDPLRELGGSNLIINVRLGEESGAFVPTNDYRQVAMIQSPRIRTTGNVASNVAHTQYMTLLLEADSSFYNEDELVYQGESLATATFVGRTLSYSNNYLRLVNITGTPEVEPIIGSETGTIRIPSGTDSIVYGDLEPYTGELLYIDNILPIVRAEDQVEDFKIIMKF